MASLAFLIVTVAFCLATAVGQNEYVYLEKPALAWEEDLAEMMPINAFATGNAVEASPDGRFLYMTTFTGILLARELHVGQPGQLSKPGGVYQYKPPDRSSNWQTKCNSGISFYTGRSSAFFVYAVRDDPPVIGSTDQEISSRIIAISHPFRSGDGPRWISPPIPGIVSGTPVISNDGVFVYVTHNTGNFGRFSALEIRNNVPKVVFSGETNNTAPGPYAPINIAHLPDEGNYRGGDANKNDLVVWGQLQMEKGEIAPAWTWGFQIPTFYDGLDTSGWSIETFAAVSWKVSTRPVLSNSGMNLYFGISKSQARGWRGGTGRKFDQGPSWKQDSLLRDESNKWVKTYPSFGGVALSSEEDLLFMPSTTTVAYALDTFDGSVHWQSNIEAISRTEPRVSPDGKVVYFQGEDGSIEAKSTEDGATIWVYKSKLIEGNTEFSLSPDGSMLYFAGNAVFPSRIAYALRVMAVQTGAPTELPTSSPTVPQTPGPTASPTTLPPTRSPTEPTSAPTQAIDQEVKPTAMPTLWWTYEPTQETSDGISRFSMCCNLLVPAILTVVALVLLA